MRVLVTGASGFVGRVLVATLAGPGLAIKAAARNPTHIAPSPHTEPVHLPDLSTDPHWPALLTDIDAVVHLAGIAHAGPGTDEGLYRRVNRDATESLAQACAVRNVPLVFVSSIRAQTGPVADRVLTEADPPRPTDAYGRSKLAAEDAIRRSGAAFTILRPVVMYGPGVKGNIAALAKLAGLPLPLPFGSFDNRRSLLAVDNLVSAVRHALATQAMRGETYIVADDQPMSFAGIITTLRAARDRKAGLIALPTSLLSAPLRLVGRTDLWDRIGGTLVADAAKLRATGWHALIETRAGLTAMVQAASPRKSGTASRRTP